MKALVRTLLFCCKESPQEVEQNEERAEKPVTEPSPPPARAESPEPEPISMSQPVFESPESSEDELQAENKTLEVSAEEPLSVNSPASEPKKKREKKPKKRDAQARATKKKPSFKSGSTSARGRDQQKEGLHKPLPPSARPAKGILKKR